MGKTIKKQTFAEDTSKYCRFLSASDVNLEASSAAIQAEIATHKKILELIQACQEKGRIDEAKLSDLIITSCPDFITMHAFQLFNNCITNSDSVDKFFDMAEEESVIINCAGTPCEICWKNYINQMAKILNQSAIDIKLYDNPGGPHGS